MKFGVGSFNLFQYVAPPFSWYTKKDSFTKQEWEKKNVWIKNQLENMHCDIVGFQEVFSKDELEKLCKEVGFDYFITVENAKIDKKNKTIFKSTTVALASKFPILKTQKVNIHIPSIKKHNFEGQFYFSRKPIKALIELPNKLQITIYVNHFKSNRLNEFEYIFSKKDSLEEKKQKVKEALENNYSQALKQRLCETSSLYYDAKKCKTPMISICDLNDKEYSISIEALTNKAYHENRKEKCYLLFDAYYLNSKKQINLHPEKKVEKRKPTSYYQSYGNIIDYIFISKHFNKKNKTALGKISSYEVFDKHLQDKKDGSLLQSDHAQIVCEIELFSL